MYAWLWRKLPFGLYGKLAGSLMLAGAVTALLWFVVFPWAEPMIMPWDDVQVEDPYNDGGGGGVDPVPSVGPSMGDEHDIPYETSEPSPTPSARRR